MGIKYLLCVCFIVTAMSVRAQNNYINCERKYFAHTHVVSTTICYDKDMRWGKATAYDKKGKQIYQKDIRRVGGHAGVTFSYYANGAVQKADYSDQPDGGIQWYKVVTYFSAEGTVTSEDDQSYDKMNRITEPARVRPPAPKKEIVTCAVPYASEYWFINNTLDPAIVLVQNKGNAKDIKSIVIQPSDTVKGGEYIMAEQFVDLSRFYDFSVKPVPDINKLFVLRPDKRWPVVHTKEIRRFYYHVVKK